MFIVYGLVAAAALFFIASLLNLAIPKEVRDLDKTPKGLPGSGVISIDDFDENLALIEPSEDL